MRIDVMLNDLIRYRKGHVDPGGFLQACLANDLMSAVGRADAESLKALPQIAAFLHHQMPQGMWGSWEAVNRHLAAEMQPT